jgi:leucyl-tRNA synthetase
MNDKYDHKDIERKWQEFWDEKKIYKVTEDPGKPKSFVLDMFPYPSGEGLHVGHPKGYIATDIYSRMKKMQGHNILHPMGFDAFGLPAENFAIKNKIHPRVAVEKNIQRFKEQLSKIGFNYDWDREINTTDPEYYKWTQWIFLKMLEKGLAYQSFEPINWCPSCQTGLANEDLESDGTCERCGSVVEKRPMRQWVLKITEYADRMLEDLGDLKWPEYIKEAQRNWIGRSEGAILRFRIKDLESQIDVFTTRADTLFGVTYIVLAPENKEIENLKSKIENQGEVEKYIKDTKQKTEIDRTDAKKEKTGVELRGVKAINPVNGEEIPVWVADYVLGNYGTGAVMAVPAHDERDFEFAKRYNLDIKEVVIPRLIDKRNPHVEGKEVVFRNAVIVVVRNPKTDKYLCLKWKKQPWVTFVMGGIEEGESAVDAAIREIKEETGYKNVRFVKNLGSAQSEFFAAHKDVNRVAHTRNFLFELIDESQDELSKEESEIHELEWRDFDGITGEDMTHSEMELILSAIKTGYLPYKEEGVMIDSGDFTRCSSVDAREKVCAKFGKKEIKYKLRDWVFSRQRYWGEPIPVVHCEKCGVVGVPEKDLPVKLPDVEHYEPTGTGESPLANIETWVNTTCPKCGGKAKRETNTMPQWAGSSWYYLRFMDPKNNEKFVDPVKEKYWAPVDVYVGGDHAVRHLIYARFWHKFLFDIGAVSTKEPFARLEFLGFILAKDGRKMSKRWGNVVNPDDIVDVWGADTLRMYEMFMGPFENTIAWKDESLIGVRRFLERVWKMGVDIRKGHQNSDKEVDIKKVQNLLHKTIKKVTEDIESFKFNTAISAMMILLNEFEGAGAQVEKADFEVFLKLLAPFAPHMAEEIWQALGNTASIHLEPWPQFEEAKIREENVKIMIQINGKVRANFVANAGISEEEAKKQALSMGEVQKWIQGLEVQKTIFVVDKLLNIVVK